MGMTIDEAIEYNKNLEMYMKISDEQEPCKFLEENHIALSMAIETMRKYQKIEQIISDGYLQGKSSGEMLLGIKEIMNGNNTD